MTNIFQNANLKIHKVNAEVNEKIVGNFSMPYSKNKNGEYFINSSFIFHREVEKIFVSKLLTMLLTKIGSIIFHKLKFKALINFSIAKTAVFDFSNVVFQRKIDFCKLTDSLMNSMFTDIWMKNLQSSFNRKISCPIEAGFYMLTNYTFQIPSIIPFPKNVFICSDFKYHGKVAGSKKFDFAFRVKAVLSYKP